MSFTIIRSNTFASMSRVLLDRVSRRATKNLLSLSTGKRINSTQDDASGFSMVRKMSARMRGLEQAVANIGNAQSLLNIASGSHQVIVDNVALMRSLLMQGADDSYSAIQRVAIQGQIDAILEEIDYTVRTTEFQGNRLLDGTFVGRSLQVGEESKDTFVFSIDDVRTAALGLIGLDVTDNATSTAGLVTLDAALEVLFEAMQTTGEILMRLDIKVEHHRKQLVGIEATRSRIEDIDYAQTQGFQIRNRLIQQLGFDAMNQAVVAPQQVLSLIAP